MVKDLKFEDFTYQKVSDSEFKVIISGKNFYDQTVDFHVKRYEEMRKLTTEQGEDYTTECFLDYDCIKVNRLDYTTECLLDYYYIKVLRLDYITKCFSD